MQWLLKSILFLIFLAVFSCSNALDSDYRSLNPEEATEQLDTLFQKTFALSDLDNAEQIFRNYTKAVDLMSQIPDTSELEARARLFFTNKLSMIGGNAEAIKQGWMAINMERGLSLEETLHFKYRVYGTLAGIYFRMGKEDSAVNILTLAVYEAETHDTCHFAAGPINNLGIYFYDKGVMDSALFYFLKAEKILDTETEKSKESMELLGSVRDNKASIHEVKKEFVQAKALFEENVVWYKQTQSPFRINNALISLLNAEVELGLKEQAKVHLLELNKNLNTENKTTELRNHIYFAEVRIKYYDLLRQPKLALNAAKELLDLRQDQQLLAIAKKSSRVTLMQFNLKQFALLMQAEQQAKEYQTKKARFRLYIIVLIIFAVFLLSGLFIALYKQRGVLNTQKIKTKENERRVVELQLDNKKRDLTDMVLHLSAKQSWAQQLDERVKLIESLKGTKRSREFKSLKSEIRNQVAVDKNLKVLYDDIESLNAEFYERLLTAFPNLTKTEKKLCSFLRLRMTNTQIAQIQNINPDSVRLGRYRLRTKLKLPKGVKLEDYLQNL